jgi:branched-chain amino acid transport system ATP-binding protein
MSAILEAHGISKHFGGVKAVQEMSFSLPQGKIVSIIGPNGAGKTTVFNLVSGMYTLDSGRVVLNGAEISGMKQHLITRNGIARTFQNIRLFKGLTILENVMTAGDPRSTYSLFDTLVLSPAMRRRERETRERARHVLSLVGMEHLGGEIPENLPYGLQRKLEIARALATEPKVLLLDEPAAGLNPSEVSGFIDLVYRLHADFGLSIMLIEHRMQVVMEMSDWIYVMNFGRLLAQGRPEEIQKNPEVIKAYIGEDDQDA